jgi:hypothetical protein
MPIHILNIIFLIITERKLNHKTISTLEKGCFFYFKLKSLINLISIFYKINYKLQTTTNIYNQH